MTGRSGAARAARRVAGRRRRAPRDGRRLGRHRRHELPTVGRSRPAADDAEHARLRPGRRRHRPGARRQSPAPRPDPAAATGWRPTPARAGSSMAARLVHPSGLRGGRARHAGTGRGAPRDRRAPGMPGPLYRGRRPGPDPGRPSQRGGRAREDDGRRRRRPVGAARRRRARLARRRAAGRSGARRYRELVEDADVPTYVLPGPGISWAAATRRSRARSPMPRLPKGPGATPEGVEDGAITPFEGAGERVFAFDLRAAAGTVRVVAIDNAAGRWPAGRTTQAQWLREVMEQARAPWHPGGRRRQCVAGRRAADAARGRRRGGLALLVGHASAYVATAGVDDPADPHFGGVLSRTEISRPNAPRRSRSSSRPRSATRPRGRRGRSRTTTTKPSSTARPARRC